jgi:hypothetical protein
MTEETPSLSVRTTKTIKWPVKFHDTIMLWSLKKQIANKHVHSY